MFLGKRTISGKPYTNFAKAFDLAITNLYSKMKKEHLILKSGLTHNDEEWHDKSMKLQRIQ